MFIWIMLILSVAILFYMDNHGNNDDNPPFNNGNNGIVRRISDGKIIRF